MARHRRLALLPGLVLLGMSMGEAAAQERAGDASASDHVPEELRYQSTVETATALRAGELVAVIDSVATDALEEGPGAGLSVAVSQGGEILFARGYGYAELEHRVPTNAETVFRVGSITKQFTAAAILHLAERGRVDIEEDVRTYLADYPTHGERITVRQLLHHTAGIPSYTGLGEQWQRAQRLDLTHEELVALFRDEDLEFQPGSEYSYSNSGYYLLGLIVEEASGMEYEDYLQRHFYEPLGLHGSHYCHKRPLLPHRARGYAVRDGALENADPISMNTPGAAGALCSTVLDLVVWTRALHQGRVLEPGTLEDMVTPGRLNDGTAIDYALGVRVDDLEGHSRVSHGGGINGFQAHLAGFPDDDLVIAILTNVSGSSRPAGRVADAIARAVLGLPPSADR